MARQTGSIWALPHPADFALSGERPCGPGEGRHVEGTGWTGALWALGDTIRCLLFVTGGGEKSPALWRHLAAHVGAFARGARSQVGV